MASEIKSDKLSPSSGTTLTIGDASDTVTLPTGVTFNIVDGVPVASGGTGIASYTAGDILYATGSTTLAKLAKGTAEQVLAMNSGATAPDWGSVDLTVLPTITAAKGGTGQTSYTTGDIVYASGSTAISKLGVGTARQALQTNAGATAPEWVNSPQSLMTAAGDILYASGANTLAKLAKGSDDEVLTLASGVPSWAAAAGGGKIGQVVQTTIEGTVTYGTASWADITGMTVDITPVATTSKILVMTDASISVTSNLGMWVKLVRDSTDRYIGDASSSRNQASKGTIAYHASTSHSASFKYLDSPSTTSATTYKLQWYPETSSTICIGRNLSDADAIYNARTANSITVMEVLA